VYLHDDVSVGAKKKGMWTSALLWAVVGVVLSIPSPLTETTQKSLSQKEGRKDLLGYVFCLGFSTVC
jgi:hypothetical protein